MFPLKKTLNNNNKKVFPDPFFGFCHQFVCNGGINCTLLRSTGEAIIAEWFVEGLMIAQEENINICLLRCGDPFEVVIYCKLGFTVKIH